MRVTQAVPDSFFDRLHRHSPLFVGAICVALSISGCASFTGAGTTSAEAPSVAATESGAQTTRATSLQKFLWIFSPYRPAIQQGNFVSQEMLSQLKPGMTRDQVRFVLGTPLLTDIFHAERWDYLFRLAKGNGEVTTSNVTVFFKNGKVDRYDGGNLPTEKEYIARIAGTVPAEAPSADMPLTQRPAKVGAPKQ
ncbi:MAG: outer membrane protein assembly factor BamE [Janthinobacterium sp.]|jgi:outer membrane protein assembly factor BamE